MKKTMSFNFWVPPADNPVHVRLTQGLSGLPTKLIRDIEYNSLVSVTVVIREAKTCNSYKNPVKPQTNLQAIVFDSSGFTAEVRIFQKTLDDLRSDTCKDVGHQACFKASASLLLN